MFCFLLGNIMQIKSDLKLCGYETVLIQSIHACIGD